MTDEHILLEKLKKKDIRAFKEFCLFFLEPLEEYAYSILKDSNRARDMTNYTVGRLWATTGFANAFLPLLTFIKEELNKNIEDSNSI